MTGDESRPDTMTDPDDAAAGDPKPPEADETAMSPSVTTGHMDPDALKDAHGRTGRMLQNAGLPFEEDEFDEADDDSSSSSSADEDSSSSSSSSSSEEE